MEQHMAIPPKFRLRLHLHPSLCLLLSLSLSLFPTLSAQTYKDIPPLLEVKPYSLSLSNDQVGMNSAVQTPDGYLWIGSTKGLIISDGHGSIMYTHDHPMYPLGLDDPNAFVGQLQQDSLGNVYASVSTDATNGALMKPPNPVSSPSMLHLMAMCLP